MAISHGRNPRTCARSPVQARVAYCCQASGTNPGCRSGARRRISVIAAAAAATGADPSTTTSRRQSGTWLAAIASATKASRAADARVG